ncbi:MAG: SGNH/GDSL hydrolase family protein [Bacteroidetes bacterium]|nr:SGNH/GDSL hydrolase family protein [Bacteroidota bacterium]
MKKNLSFLALGDSYTIGEGVSESDRWPVLLASKLSEIGIPVDLPVIIAKTGWTTNELSDGILESNPEGPFDLVSLLIGVNNQYRHLDPETYRTEFAGLLDEAIFFADKNPSHILVLSIPDWGVTPFANDRNPEKISEEIDRFNTINREESEKRQVNYVDITTFSREVKNDPSFLAGDLLHPSGKAYEKWSALALSILLPVLKEEFQNEN